ncbi:hypothetical protein [Chengkuizengella axinellae]|uniref:Transcriptional regulator n=1 Tax=Chengkuizengella axinellae TaxID=3064388 RepID=A0ABT9J581_9BACL|nr:hypothetical protein [Chengkuizengella sp. 2205SS18-9]MDP5276104.1 hypothetical protein [Chengkuizengella sp. 2205SS18-9]
MIMKDAETPVLISKREGTALLYLSFCGVMQFRQLSRFFKPFEAKKKINTMIEKGIIQKNTIFKNKTGVKPKVIYQLTVDGMKIIKIVPNRIRSHEYVGLLSIAELITKLYENVPIQLKRFRMPYRVIEIANVELYIAYMREDLRLLKNQKHIIIGPSLYDFKPLTDSKSFVRFALQNEVFLEPSDRLFYKYENDEWIKEINAMFAPQKNE